MRRFVRSAESGQGRGQALRKEGASSLHHSPGAAGICAPALQLSSRLRAAGIYSSVMYSVLLQIKYVKIVGQSHGFLILLLLDRSPVTPVSVTPMAGT